MFQIEALQELFYVFGQDVALQVYAGTGAVSAEGGVAEGVGNDGHTEHAAFERGDGEADAIDGDGSFVYQVRIELGGDANAQPPVVIAEGVERQEFAGAIDVALDDVAAEAAAGGKGALQIDARTGAQVAQIAAPEGLRGEIGGEGIGPQIDGGKTDAVDGDAGALGRCPPSTVAQRTLKRAPLRGCVASTVPSSSIIPVNIEVSFHGEFVRRNGMDGDVVYADGVGAAAPSDAAGQRQGFQAA